MWKEFRDTFLEAAERRGFVILLDIMWLIGSAAIVVTAVVCLICKYVFGIEGY